MVPSSREDDWLARGDEPWTERYEDLRCQALKAMDGENSRGLALVIRHGLLTWMQTWPRPLAGSPHEPSVTPPAELPALTIDSPLRLELAHILATVILQQRQEVLS